MMPREQVYEIQYSVWHDRAGCLVRRKEQAKGNGRRDAWKQLREKLSKEFDREFFCGHMRYKKECIAEVTVGK